MEAALKLNSNPPVGAGDGGAEAPAAYTLTDLGAAPDSAPLLPVALNDAGQAAVHGHPARRADGEDLFSGFLWQDGLLRFAAASAGRPPVAALGGSGLLAGHRRMHTPVMRAWASHLGVFGAERWRATESCAAGVNAAGEVAGYVVADVNSVARRRAFWISAGGVVQFLDPVPGGGAQAVAINDRGDVLVNAGNSAVADMDSRAWLWQDGRFHQVGGPGAGRLWGTALTAEGRVAGRALTLSGQLHAFLWADGVLHDLNPDPDCESEALAANDHGVVVGRCVGPGGSDPPSGGRAPAACATCGTSCRRPRAGVSRARWRSTPEAGLRAWARKPAVRAASC